MSVLREAIQAVPSVRYALGVVGIGAALSIVLTFVTDYRVGIGGVAVMLVFMVLLAIFQRLSVLDNRTFRYPALFLLWAFPGLTVATLCLVLTSVFFAWPLGLSSWLATTPSAPGRTSPMQITLSLAEGESPYSSTRITSPPPSIKDWYSEPAEYPTGYYLWPELDYNIVLFGIRAGLEMGPGIYMDRETFLGGSNTAERAKAVRVWQMFEALGRRLRLELSRGGEDSVAVRNMLPEVPELDAQLGIAFLRLVYPESRPDQPEIRANSDRAILIADRLFPSGAQLIPQGDSRQNEALRLLATHRVQPVIEITAVNSATAPEIVTAVRLDVLEVVGAFSALDSGPLTPVDVVKFELGSKPGSKIQPLARPVKIAGSDAVVIRAFLRSDFMFGYLCRFTLLSGDRVVGQSQDFLVDFGFQAPESPRL